MEAPSSPTAAPTATAVGCADTFTFKDFDNSSFDGCYLAPGDDYGRGFPNPYFLDGVSDVDGYLSILQSDFDPTPSTDVDLGPGPVVYIYYSITSDTNVSPMKQAQIHVEPQLLLLN